MKESEFSSGYLPGLHGLRALAASAVVLLHIGDRLHDAGLPSYGHTLGHKFAVTVFFTLSGFLITYLLLIEKKSSSKVNILQFYIRRTLRIWPLYFLALGSALLFDALVQAPYDGSMIIWYLIFAANVPAGFFTTIPHASHLWSLGVEEQFYLFWPWMIRLSKRPIHLLIGFLVVFLAAKVLAIFLLGRAAPLYLFLQLTRFDCMAIGGIGAWMYWQGIPDDLKRILFAIPTQVGCWLALIATFFAIPHRFDVLDHTMIGGVTMVLIFNLVANPKPLIRIENRFWRFMGGISFGIYVWHPIVLSSSLLIMPMLPIGTFGKLLYFYLSAFAGTVLVAHLSMKYFEMPFLKLKRKFHAATNK